MEVIVETKEHRRGVSMLVIFVTPRINVQITIWFLVRWAVVLWLTMRRVNVLRQNIGYVTAVVSRIPKQLVYCCF